MTAYLAPDFSIKDIAAFMPYVDAIPTFIAEHGSRSSFAANPGGLERDKTCNVAVFPATARRTCL